MKKMLFVLMLFAVMLLSCESVDFKGDMSNTVKAKVTMDDGKVVDMDCKIGLVMDDGIENKNECIGYFQSDGDTYRCSVSVEFLKKKDAKDKLTVKENCEIVIDK
jgi:hypothetical protein